jgi:hypothetical protein
MGSERVKHWPEHGSLEPKHVTNYITGWSKSLCAPDDYNTESYK